MSEFKKNKNKQEGGERMYLTPKQVEEFFGLSKKWLANMRWQKRGIPYRKVGGKILYRKKDVEEFIERHVILVIED